MDSKALRLGMACVALLGLVACGGDTRPTIMIDASTGTDSGTPGPVDGGGPRDSGGGGGTCGTASTTSPFAEMPAGCLPRCSGATLTEFMACTTAACQTAALEGDTTPPGNIDFGGTIEPIDCSDCVNIQGNSCVFDSCPDQLNAYAECFLMDPATAETRCTAEDTALNTCVETNMTAVQTCYSNRASRCFGGGGAAAGGESGSGGAPSFSMTPDQIRSAARSMSF